MIAARIDTNTALVWAKTKSVKDLEAIIVNESRFPPKEIWRFAFFAVIAVISGLTPFWGRSLLSWGLRLTIFVVGLIAVFVAVRPLQRSADRVVTAEYALKLKEQLGE